MAYETISTIANTAARPGSPTDGMIRYQQDIQSCIVYDGGATAWKIFTPDDAPYDIDGTNILSTTPSYHFDAAMVNGTDASGNPSDATAFTGVWTSRTNSATSPMGMCTIAQGTASKQPTYYTAGTNSKPYLSFDGGDLLAVSEYSEYFKGEGPFTAFCVGEKGADTSGSFSPFLMNFELSKTVWFNFTNGTDYLFFGSTGASSGKTRPDIDGSTATYATTRMFLITRDSSNNGDWWVDGANQNTALASTASDDVGPQVSGRGVGYTNYTTTGHIYEFAFFNSDLSTADRNKLIAYVNTKYGAGRNADDSGTFARVTF